MDATKITFLADSPEKLSERDDLSHIGLAKRIVQAVKTCPTPYTIGLSGEWGSGKTTVAQYVRDELKTGEKPTPVVYFDAWKYQRDSLRRQFLIETHKQLSEANYLKSDDLTEAELYETRSFQHSPEVDWQSVIPWKSRDPWASWLRVVIFVASVGSLGFAMFGNSSTATRLVATLLGGTGISTLISFLPRLFVSGTPTDVKPPITSAEEFGKKFATWLDRDKLKATTLLVIVDNVDRCDDTQIIELLGDIKTFLEPPGARVVFLLPVDEGAVRRVLTERYGTMDAANEFLRKFFNTVFRIPVPLAGETRLYALFKLDKTGLILASAAAEAERGKVITVMTAAYPNNPRRVIQFLNRLSSQWLLLASTAEELKKAEIAADLGAIAKGVAIRERWPELAALLENSPLELAKVEKEVLDGKDDFHLVSSGVVSGTADKGMLPGLGQFLRATQTIPLSRPRLILTGKADRFEVELPDAELLRAFLRGEQSEGLDVFLQTDAWEEAAAAGHVSDFIKQELADLWTAQQFEGVGVLLSVVGPALPDMQEENRRDLADSLAETLNNSAVVEALAKLKPAASIQIAEYSNSFQSRAREAITQLLGQTDANRRIDFTRALGGHSESLALIKDSVLAQASVREDALALENLLLTDGQPNHFWDAGVVQAACANVAASSDQATLTRSLESARRLLSALADKAVDVQDVVLKLLANESIEPPDEAFKWAARSEMVLIPHGDVKVDMEPTRLRAESVREKGGAFSRLEYLALIGRLHSGADSASSTRIDTELSTWLGTVPLDPNDELGDWFPQLELDEVDIPTRLFNAAVGFKQPEAHARVQFARQQGISWPRIGQEIAKLLSAADRIEDAIALGSECIAANEGRVPEEFLTDIWSGLLKLIFDGSTYRAQLLPLMQEFTKPDGSEGSLVDRSRELHHKLIDAMAADQARLTDYESLAVGKADGDDDFEYGLEKLKSRQITPSSGPFLTFLVKKPPVRHRSDLLRELSILATDGSHWSLGLHGLDSIEWSPGVQNAARVATTLANDAFNQRESSPERAVAALRTTLHMAKFARDRTPRDDIEQAITALRRSNVITDEQEAEFSEKLNSNANTLASAT